MISTSVMTSCAVLFHVLEREMMPWAMILWTQHVSLQSAVLQQDALPFRSSHSNSSSTSAAASQYLEKHPSVDA